MCGGGIQPPTQYITLSEKKKKKLYKGFFGFFCFLSRFATPLNMVELYPFFLFAGGGGANPPQMLPSWYGVPVHLVLRTMFHGYSNIFSLKLSLAQRYCWISNKTAPFHYRSACCYRFSLYHVYFDMVSPTDQQRMQGKCVAMATVFEIYRDSIKLPCPSPADISYSCPPYTDTTVKIALLYHYRMKNSTIVRL